MAIRLERELWVRTCLMKLTRLLMVALIALCFVSSPTLGDEISPALLEIDERDGG